MAPYMRPLTDLVVAYIENEGIEVLDSICFEIPDNLEVGLRDPMQLVDDVRGLPVPDGQRSRRSRSYELDTCRQ
jgi:maleate isomerase